MRGVWLCVLAAVVTGAPAMPAAQSSGLVRVVIETDKGVFEIEVDTARAPVTAANFLRYVDAGRYDGGAFYRTVRPDTEIREDVHIQVIQGGMPRGRGGAGTARAFEPIPLERTSVTGLRHVDGTVSMARSDPDSATSEFFICVGDQPELDFGGARNADGQGFAAFGRVVSGFDVVKLIHTAPAREGTETLEPPVGIRRVYRKGPAGGGGSEEAAGAEDASAFHAGS